MRVSDLLMNTSYLNGIANNKSKMDLLSKQIANQSSILKPSDSPIGTSKILRLNSKISATDLYLNNIENSFGFVDETIRAMESIESQVSNILVKLSEANNSVNKENLSTFADQLDNALDSILSAANTSYDGKYVFGGTTFSSKPYSITSDRSAVYVNVNDVSGKSTVKIGSSSNKQINISGAELFGTIIKQNGTFDSSAAVGSVVNDTTTIRDAYGNQYDLLLSYEKTSATEYTLTYDIQDGGGSSILSNTVNLEFDAYTGDIAKVNGKENSEISINDTTHKINFVLNFDSLKVGSSASPLSLSSNQERDIFNTIIKIRDDLKNGLTPDQADVDAVNEFHKRLLNKMSDAGFTYNTLENTKSLLENQRVEIEGMISSEKDLDVAKAIIDMQNYEYLLEVSYKMSAMILPKSLLDFI